MNKSILALSVAIALSSSLTACSPTSDKTISAQQTVKAEAQSKSLTETQQLNLLLSNFFDELLKRDPLKATSVGEHQYNDKFIAPISKEK